MQFICINICIFICVTPRTHYNVNICHVFLEIHHVLFSMGIPEKYLPSKLDNVHFYTLCTYQFSSSCQNKPLICLLKEKCIQQKKKAISDPGCRVLNEELSYTDFRSYFLLHSFTELFHQDFASPIRKYCSYFLCPYHRSILSVFHDQGS